MNLTLLTAILAATATVNAEEPFHVYAPSPSTQQLWVIAAKPTAEGIDLSVGSKVDLGFAGRTISLHPTKPVLYVGAGGGASDEVPAASVSLDPLRRGHHRHRDPVRTNDGHDTQPKIRNPKRRP